MKDMPEGVIVQYTAESDQVYSWKNVLLETENFEEAKKKFHQFYAQVKKATAVYKQMSVRLIADYTEPDEVRKFNTIIFKLETIEKSFKDVVVDLSMRYEMDEWKITVSLYHVEDESKLHMAGNADN
jgi:hypothetical protein